MRPRKRYLCIANVRKLSAFDTLYSRDVNSVLAMLKSVNIFRIFKAHTWFAVAGPHSAHEHMMLPKGGQRSLQRMEVVEQNVGRGQPLN